jgi:hypothetical protein
MRIFRSEFAHPTQASRVGLSVFESPRGFLLTEDRSGPSTVFATLGVFDGREQALERAKSRGEELQAQRYRPTSSSA